MATFKFIQPSSETINKLQLGLSEIDSLSKRSQEKIEAASRSICLMLREKDSAPMRMRIRTLCELIEYHACDVMNEVNSFAEQYGANHVDEYDRAEKALIQEATRAALI